MDKYEYKLKLEQLKSLVAAEDYETAAEIANSINWKKVRNANTLCMVAKIYDETEQYDECRDVLLQAYDHSSLGRNIIAQLVEVAIKAHNIREAEEYYSEFLEIAPKDNQRFIIAYKIATLKGASLADRIAILEELKEREYTEMWAYELAELYDEAGMAAYCVETCDELILWFGDGEYVEKAFELKRKYQALTAAQEEKYQKLRNQKPIVDVQVPKRVEATISEESGLPEIKVSSSKFNTLNLQEELAKNMKQIMAATGKEAVSDTMDTIKKLVNDIPEVDVEERTAPESDPVDELITAEVEQVLQSEGKGLTDQGPIPVTPVDDGEQIEGQLSIEEVLADWERTKKAAEEAIKNAEKKKLNRAKAKALNEANEIMQRLQDLFPILNDEDAQDDEEEAEDVALPESFLTAVGEIMAEKNQPVVESPVQKQEAPAEEEELPEIADVEAILAAEMAAEAPVEIPQEPAVEEVAEEVVEEPVAEDIPVEEEIPAEEPTAEEVIPEAAPAEEEIPAEEPVAEEVIPEAAPTEEEIPAEEPVAEEIPVEEEILPEVMSAEEVLAEEPVVEEAVYPEGATKEMPIISRFSAEPEEVVEEPVAEEEEPAVEAAETEPVAEETVELEEEPVVEEPVVEEVVEEPAVEEEEPQVEFPAFKLPTLESDPVQTEVPLPADLMGDMSEMEIPQEEAPVQPSGNRLSEEDKKMFSYFIPVPGMEEQIVNVLDNTERYNTNTITSKRGNIIVQGEEGSGKTVLATSLIKAVQKVKGNEGAKIGKISAEALNRKDFASLVPKIAGGYLIIEKAGELSKEAIARMNQVMEGNTQGMIVILEDTSTGIKKALAADPAFKSKFTSRVKIPVFTIDELVEFGKAYAAEMECVIETMGVLALYNRINSIQKLDQPTTLAEVKDIVDEAIESAELGGFKKLFAKKYNDNDYLILREKDFGQA